MAFESPLCVCIVQESGKNLREHWCAGLVALLSGTLPLMRLPHVSAIWASTCVLEAHMAFSWAALMRVLLWENFPDLVL